jgi:alkenylglycerophosphocholine hydrolase
MAAVWLGLAFLAAIGETVALLRANRRLEYFTKPAVMVCLLAYLAASSGVRGPLLWFGLGLLLSLVGDVLLIVPENRFIYGLAAFLLAHLAYIIGFNLPPAPVTGMTLIIAVLIGISMAPLVRKILISLRRKGQVRLVTPVQIYATVITLMLLSAMLTFYRTDWIKNAALLAGSGAVLFVTSDLVLAWNLFVTPIKNGRILNIALYHLGQMALIAGAIMQFGG